MPKQGQPTGQRVTPANRAEKKRTVVAEIAKGRTIKEAADIAGCSRRTVRDWRVKDEKFAVEMANAQDSRRDVLVKSLFDIAMDPNEPTRDRVISLIFLTKQADPSFRDNHKTELSLSPEMASSLTKLAKLAETK